MWHPDRSSTATGCRSACLCLVQLSRPPLAASSPSPGCCCDPTTDAGRWSVRFKGPRWRSRASRWHLPRTPHPLADLPATTRSCLCWSCAWEWGGSGPTWLGSRRVGGVIRTPHTTSGAQVDQRHRHQRRPAREARTVHMPATLAGHQSAIHRWPARRLVHSPSRVVRQARTTSEGRPATGRDARRWTVDRRRTLPGNISIFCGVHPTGTVRSPDVR